MITWLPQSLLTTPGRLGLTRTPGSSDAASTVDLDAFVTASVHVVICLQEAFELEMLSPPETLEQRRSAVESRGMRFVHEPVTDMDVPSLPRMQRMAASLLADLDASRNVVVHCWAGLGRAGTLAACALVARGLTPLVAVSRLRRERPGAVQSVLQERLIRQFGDAQRSGPALGSSTWAKRPAPTPGKEKS